MSLSEVITILIWFHLSGYRTFKQYYEDYVQQHLRSEFPDLWSYTRFVEWMPRSVDVLILYLLSKRGSVTGISFVDSTSLAVCRNQRILQHKVFRGLAERGKTSMGWFYGFKLHLIINDRGEIISFAITPGNEDDRKPVPHMAKGLFGKLFGDKGYISRKLTEALLAMGVQLVTPLRKNMIVQIFFCKIRVSCKKEMVRKMSPWLPCERIGESLSQSRAWARRLRRPWTGTALPPAAPQWQPRLDLPPMT
jgi:hypothetical protein